MDPSSLIPPLTAVAATTVIAVIRDSTTRVFENSTKRIQFWKTTLDVAPLADINDLGFLEEQCRQEVEEVVGKVQAVRHEFVRKMSFLIALGLWFVFLRFASYFSVFQLAGLRRAGASSEVFKQFEYISMVLQILGLLIIWFWARRKIAEWIWEQIRPGAVFGVLSHDQRWQRGVGCVLLLLLFAMLWFFHTI